MAPKQKPRSASSSSRANLYALFMEAPALICVLRGPDHVYDLVNPQYQQLFGDRQLVGKPIRDALPELKGQGFFELLDGVYRTGHPYFGKEARALLESTASGKLEERFFNFIYQPLYDDGNVYGVTVFGFDVTEQVLARRGAAQDVETAKEQVRRSEEMFRLLVESVVDYAIYMLDAEGRIVTWNSGAERIKGYAADEVLGRHVSMFYPEADVQHGLPEEELRLARERGTEQDEGWRVRKDGTMFWADIVITAVTGEDGELRGYAKVTRDITERKQAEETQRALFEQRTARLKAEEANRAKDEFIALVSHELRTPLTSILGWARLLRMGNLDPNNVAEALDALERSAQAQVHLVEDLLDTARITSGKLRLEMRPLDLKPVVEAAIADVTPIAGAKQIHITADLQCGCTMVGDPTRLQQVVWNVLSNAIKFTAEGGCVSVSLREQQSAGEIEVRDTGLGIDPELLPRLFKRFQQGDPGSKDRKGGLGLGLSLSRFLVEQHGGSIEAASGGVGMGSTFTIRLPLAAEGAGSFVGRETGRALDLPRLDGLRVLIVEDEIDNRDMLARVAQQCGAEVDMVSTAGEALLAVQQSPPDVMVCDIALPDFDGCRLLERIRATPAGRKLPALALTVFGSAGHEEKLIAAGFDVFRQKPIEPADFAHVISRLAGRSKVGIETP